MHTSNSEASQSTVRAYWIGFGYQVRVAAVSDVHMNGGQANSL